MGWSIRVMERKDVAKVCHLLTKVFPDNGLSLTDWQETINWLYFSPDIKDGVPRAFVIANEDSIVGHIGLTYSELTHGDKSFKVVQTVNWVVDPDHRTGLLALRLMLEASSLGDVAIVIGGSLSTQRIIPKIGYQKQLDVGRYIKVMKPWRFLCMARSPEQLGRNTAKLVVFLVSSLLRWFKRSSKTRNQKPETGNQKPATSDQRPDQSSYPASDGGIDSREKREVLRNSLKSEFLHWYRQCPRGIVHVLRIFSEGTVIGQATIIIKSRKGTCYANILNVDASTEDERVWIKILDAVEDFLRERKTTHVNAIGTYEPWCRALKYKGYCKLKNMPFWVRDKSDKFTDVKQWHITAIEGDLGYLFE